MTCGETMTTHLSRFFRERREARKLSFGDLARQLGYKNVAKGANKVIKFERDERIVDKLEVPKKKRKTKKKPKNVASRQQPTVIGIGSRVLWGRTQFYVVARNDECLGIARRADGSVETW